LLPELPSLLAEAQRHTGRYQAGGTASIFAYRDLLALLFSATVMGARGGLQVNTGRGQQGRGVITPLGGPSSPLPLTGGGFLRISISLFLGETEKASGMVLKVAKENFQYQLDEEGDRWVFRYEYERDPREDPHPQAHLHVRAQLLDDVEQSLTKPLDRIHFPTGRVSVPAIIRLLVEQFAVECNRESHVWRPVFAQVERDFQSIAHQTLSGPET
jgi:hypothetical protein